MFKLFCAEEKKPGPLVFGLSKWENVLPCMSINMYTAKYTYTHPLELKQIRENIQHRTFVTLTIFYVYKKEFSI